MGNLVTKSYLHLSLGACLADVSPLLLPSSLAPTLAAANPDVLYHSLSHVHCHGDLSEFLLLVPNIIYFRVSLPNKAGEQISECVG